ncbi:MAG: hypothetical protein HZB09_00325 [Candidatus Yonathbacteria bacterium]|nr:hypothetical protein [Candidatus Yonathbacteria bacterium]
MSSITSLFLKKKKRPVALFLLVLFAIFIPSYVFADLVPCNGADCDFNDFIDLINNVINFLMFKFAVPLAAISFAIAGVMILTAGGNTGQVEKAKEIFWNVLIGLIVALAAWLVVNAILVGLGAKPLGTI